MEPPLVILRERQQQHARSESPGFVFVELFGIPRFNKDLDNQSDYHVIYR